MAIVISSKVCPKCKGLGRSWIKCLHCNNQGFFRVTQEELPGMPEATPEDLARVAAIEAGRRGDTEGPEPWPHYFICPQCDRKTQPAWLGADYCWECQPYHG